MNKIVSTLFLAAGIALLVLGIMASRSMGSDVSRFFTGSPTDKAVWFLVGGLAAFIVGGFGLFRERR